jgi:hypothetical protein
MLFNYNSFNVYHHVGKYSYVNPYLQKLEEKKKYNQFSAYKKLFQLSQEEIKQDIYIRGLFADILNKETPSRGFMYDRAIEIFKTQYLAVGKNLLGQVIVIQEKSFNDFKNKLYIMTGIDRGNININDFPERKIVKYKFNNIFERKMYFYVYKYY